MARVLLVTHAVEEQICGECLVLVARKISLQADLARKAERLQPADGLRLFVRQLDGHLDGRRGGVRVHGWQRTPTPGMGGW